ncbi:glycoside hydrolase family 32 protein [Vibrio misgurnus]|uniref:glycoside hydrolase family 32 protein n=1 Tax=Vibrio misgurnus TaxID=2993714 RepID=UPI00241699B8|nr:glycoside hydrolase family 32 protein [Vibrio sp. gvc]
MRSHLLVLCSTLLISGCGSDNNSTNIPTISTSHFSGIYPKPFFGYVGDPMPFWDDGQMNIFYLHDSRDGQIGFHPYNLMTTKNLVDWEFHGTVIPFVNDNHSTDLALGTGSIIKDNDGLYHAYYTGWNGRSDQLPNHEVIQHATSTDKLNWTKHPDHGFYGGHNDFRDPYVLFIPEFNEYWMIITTRDSTTDKPILARYTSTDLVSWGNRTVFYSSNDINWNMECPTLIKIGDYWYLSFSRQGNGNERTLYYVYTNNLNATIDETTWTKPNQHLFDGPGQYAARIENFGSTHIVTGWVGTKKFNSDAGDYEWAGNLVTHEVYQADNGELFAREPDTYRELTNKSIALNTIKQSSSIALNHSDILFSGDGYESISFSPVIGKTSRLSMTVGSSGTIDHYGFIFSLDGKTPRQGNTKLEFNHKTNKINLFVNNLSIASVISSIDFIFPPNEYSITLYSEGNIITVYINNKVAFTSRLPSSADKEWGLFTYQSPIKLSNISFSSN